MTIHPVDPDIRKFWKAFPLRIPGGSTCFHCREETVLVQSMKGGFVTRNCPTCNKSDTLPELTFKRLGLWVACPRCKARMKAEVFPNKNYGYMCVTCGIGIPLFELLPKYEDL
jgi:ssDNA-binding Zn-finger/Zn-ribbon topoisomerase 1